MSDVYSGRIVFYHFYNSLLFLIVIPIVIQIFDLEGLVSAQPGHCVGLVLRRPQVGLHPVQDLVPVLAKVLLVPVEQLRQVDNAAVFVYADTLVVL